MSRKFLLNLQLFADSGTNVNLTTNWSDGPVNAYTGVHDTSVTAANRDMRPTMKEYYDTELLENARPQLLYAQLGKKMGLPSRHGKTVEWRKFNTFAPAMTPLSEGVIPTGKTFGMTSINVHVNQFGDYVTISDVLDVHAVDPIILGATEEMGAAAGETKDTLVRNVLAQGTNVLFAPKIVSNVLTPVTQRSGLDATAKLTPDVVNRAVTWLKKCKVPRYDGQWYVAVVHPSITYDLRSSNEWIEAHKYSATRQIFNGEIGELHGCRFIEDTEAPIVPASSSSGAPMVYLTLFFGKDAFGVIDPEAMGMEMIVKSRAEVGGPLEQFSTVGYKFETAAKILYQERLLRVESCSTFSSDDSSNFTPYNSNTNPDPFN